MLTALIGVSWCLTLGLAGLLGYTLIHFTARIDALEDAIAGTPAEPLDLDD